MEAHRALKKFGKVRLLKLRITTPSFWEDIIIPGIEGFKDFESDSTERIRNLHNTPQDKSNCYVIVSGMWVLNIDSIATSNKSQMCESWHAYL
jgi:hypothetical protein